MGVYKRAQVGVYKLLNSTVWFPNRLYKLLNSKIVDYIKLLNSEITQVGPYKDSIGSL